MSLYQRALMLEWKVRLWVAKTEKKWKERYPDYPKGCIIHVASDERVREVEPK